jgi:phage shock protein A
MWNLFKRQPMIQINHADIHIHGDPDVKPSLDSITNKLKTIMATQAELAQQLRDVTAQNEKARGELETALANAGNTTPEVDEALAALKASVQTDDDLNADAPTEPPVEG